MIFFFTANMSFCYHHYFCLYYCYYFFFYNSNNLNKRPGEVMWVESAGHVAEHQSEGWMRDLLTQGTESRTRYITQ